jgi:hypothetical protein
VVRELLVVAVESYEEEEEVLVSSPLSGACLVGRVLFASRESSCELSARVVVSMWALLQHHLGSLYIPRGPPGSTADSHGRRARAPTPSSRVGDASGSSGALESLSDVSTALTVTHWERLESTRWGGTRRG